MATNPYTAFVHWPVDVEKFSAGKAKKALKAIECPSMSNRRCLPFWLLGVEDEAEVTLQS